MNRHGYGAGANGQHSSGRNNFSIATDKYDKYVSYRVSLGRIAVPLKSGPSGPEQC